MLKLQRSSSNNGALAAAAAAAKAAAGGSNGSNSGSNNIGCDFCSMAVQYIKLALHNNKTVEQIEEVGGG